MTNYMTIADAEIDDLEARLWRLKQAIEIKDPNFTSDRLDDEMMKLRFDATLRLHHIIDMQRFLWEGIGEDEKKKLLESGKTAKQLIDEEGAFEPDYSSMADKYKIQFDDADAKDFIHPDTCWLSVTRPQDSMSRDWPEDLKKERSEIWREFWKKHMKKEAFEKECKVLDEDSKLTPIQRYERTLRGNNEWYFRNEGKPLYTEDEIKAKVESERDYYEKLEKNELKATGYYIGG